MNVYSYESDLSIGGEWWIGRRRGKRVVDDAVPSPALLSQTTGEVGQGPGERERIAGREAILEEGDLRASHSGPEAPQPVVTEEVAGPFAHERVYPVIPPRSQSRTIASETTDVGMAEMENDRDGILKAKISGNWVSRSMIRCRYFLPPWPPLSLFHLRYMCLICTNSH